MMNSILFSALGRESETVKWTSDFPPEISHHLSCSRQQEQFVRFHTRWSSRPPRVNGGQWPCPTVIHRLSGECMFTHVIKPVSVWLCLTTHNLLLHQRLSVCSLRWMKCKFWALTCGVGKIVGVSKSKLHFERIQPTASRATQHQPRYSCCRSAGRYVSSYCATFNKLS